MKVKIHREIEDLKQSMSGLSLNLINRPKEALSSECLNTSDGLSDLIDQIALTSSASNSVENSPVSPTEVSSPIETELVPVSTNGRLLRNKRIYSTTNTEDKLHQIKKRTISRPRKLNPATLGTDASDKLIEKLYTSKKMTKLKPTNLETIFEEPKLGKNETVTYISATRFKRSINFTDYNNVPKQTVKNRRKKVKRLLGGCKLKKMSMDTFMERFNKLRDNVEPDLN